MKKAIVGSLLLFSILANAQQAPVGWKFWVKKLAEKTYEVHIIAIVEKGWHVFSTVQPKGSIPMPTKIKFSSNPMFTLSGGIREIGKLEIVKEALLGTISNQYEGSVDFVQVIKEKKSIKTNITGSVNFQTCTNERCLPQGSVKFSLVLE